MIKMIVCDLDETLLGADGSISPENVAAIQAASAQGVKFVPNTGRPYSSVQSLLQKLGLVNQPNEYVISYNGGVIVENLNNQILQTQALPFTTAEQIFAITSRFKNSDTHVYALNNLQIYRPHPEDVAYIKTRGVQYRELKEQSLAQFADQPILKVIAMSPDKQTRVQIHDDVMTLLGNQLNASYSSGLYTEFNPIEADKGNAALTLGKRLGIQASEIMAIGDNGNDLPMLRKVGLPISVSNGTAEVKSTVKYVTQANYVTGVAEAIHKFVLA